MTNGETYKTAKERAEAFRDYCYTHKRCEGCVMREKHENPFMCSFHWLGLEAPEKELLPCPFCGCAECTTKTISQSDWKIVACGNCGYRTGEYLGEDLAIAAHNRVARAAKEKEANDANA